MLHTIFVYHFMTADGKMQGNDLFYLPTEDLDELARKGVKRARELVAKMEWPGVHLTGLRLSRRDDELLKVDIINMRVSP